MEEKQREGRTEGRSRTKHPSRRTPRYGSVKNKKKKKTDEWESREILSGYI